MGTMFGFVTTDATIEQPMLDLGLKEVTKQTFNCNKVEGNKSTNDMHDVVASDMDYDETLTPEHDDFEVFVDLLKQTCEDLAKMNGRDGDGDTKLIEVAV